MNKIILSVTLILSNFPSFAEIKKNQQQERVLNAIQMICEDVWCESVTRYFFKKLAFNKNTNTTSIIFEIFPPGYPLKVKNNRFFTASIEQRKFRMQCEIKDHSSLDQILDPDGSLAESFYERLSDCILSVEEPIGAMGEINEKG